jgi:hypothetical protein
VETVLCQVVFRLADSGAEIYRADESLFETWMAQTHLPCGVRC